MPDLLSGAYIAWDVAWLSDDDSMLLYGSALTPLGDTVVARLPVGHLDQTVVEQQPAVFGDGEEQP